MPAEVLVDIRDALLDDLADYQAVSDTESRRLTERIHAIRRERFKWAEKAMEEVLPRDIAKAKQEELATQLAQTEAGLARFGSNTAEHAELIRIAISLIADCGEAYRSADDTTRRAYSQAWFERLYLDQDAPGVITTRPEHTEIVEAIQTATVRPIKAARSRAQKPNGRGPVGYRVHSVAQGVITPCLVEVAGIEPASFVVLMGLLRAQCAVSLLGPISHAHKLM